MTGALLNVGLNVGKTVNALTLTRVVAAVEEEGGRIRSLSVHPSASEPTAIIELEAPLHRHALYGLADALDQDAVTQWDGLRGDIEGPFAAAWGAFDPDFFLTLDGRPLGHPQAVAA